MVSMDTAEHRRDNRLGLVVMANARRDVPVDPISTASLRAKYIVADDRHALVLHTTGDATDQVDGGVHVSGFKLDSRLEF